LFAVYRFCIIGLLHSGTSSFIQFAAGRRAVLANFAAHWVPIWACLAGSSPLTALEREQFPHFHLQCLGELFRLALTVDRESGSGSSLPI